MDTANILYWWKATQSCQVNAHAYVPLTVFKEQNRKDEPTDCCLSGKVGSFVIAKANGNFNGRGRGTSSNMEDHQILTNIENADQDLTLRVRSTVS